MNHLIRYAPKLLGEGSSSQINSGGECVKKKGKTKTQNQQQPQKKYKKKQKNKQQVVQHTHTHTIYNTL